MKYFVAMALLAAPLAMAAAPTPAEAGHRDGMRCHMVKKTVWKWGKKRTKWVQVCRKQPRPPPPLSDISRPPPARAAFLTAASAGGFFCGVGSRAPQKKRALPQRRQPALLEVRMAVEHIAALELARNR